MIIYRDADIDEIRLENTAVALGEFDAVHIGHREIIKQTVKKARESGLKSVVFMFENNPSELICGKKIQAINSLDMRLSLIEELGADVVVSVKFDKEFADITRERFFYDYLIDKLDAKYLAVGYNYSFGQKGLGDTSYLKSVCDECKVELNIVPEITLCGETVSSTRVRELVSRGDVETAECLLGRSFSLEGIVSKGDGIGGKLLGFPTANIRINDRYVLPKFGVYISAVRLLGKVYPSITNIGGKPTIRDNFTAIETHIIDHEFPELYGQSIEVEFCRFLRDTVMFDDIDDLHRQIEKDKAFAKEYFALSGNK